MKLLLPKVLLSAVLSDVVFFSAQAVEIPDNYKSVEVQSADSLTNYTTNSDTDHYAFLLGMDVEVPADISLSGGHLLFATKDGQASASMTFGGASSHAFSEVDTLTFNTLSNLSFSGIAHQGGYGGASHDIYGGAIHVNDGGTLIISHVNDNQAGTTDVLFENNVVLGYDGYVFGAAIYAGEGSTVEISYNGDVSFSGNSATAPTSSYESTAYTSSFGGAIYAGGNVSISNNGNVSFSANSASASSYFGTRSPGGAIHAEGNVSISNNGDVSFSGNSAVSSNPGSYHITCTPYGGAILAWGAVTISNNVDVSFSGNSASTSDTFNAAFGGAIYAGDTLTISNNADVSFSGNSASVDSFGDTYGGAIHAMKNLNIQGNDSVTFEQNYERVGSVYLLRSIYQDGRSGGSMNLSAKTGGHITFYDSVYGGATALNADYTDAEGNTQKAKGDIIFSGKYAKEHLDEILEADGAGRTATVEEILNSRTTVINGLTNLYGGRLRVEDGAIYKGEGITAMEGSAATVLVKDATLNHDGFALTFNAGTTLQVEGESLIVGDVLMQAQSVLNLDGETTINGALTLGLGMQLAGNVLTEVQNLQVGQSITLVSGLESLAVQTQNLMRSVEYTTVMDGYEVQASEYFANLAGNTGLVIRYDSEGGTVSITQTMAVPEPTTATLSLFALAALAARRRRK